MASRLEPVWNFVPIDKKHQRKLFDCGYPELNQYLSRYARQNHLKGVNKTFVATKAITPLKIDGYYTISSSTIAFASFPKSYQQGIPNYPIPCALIGRLAVDVSCQGQGLVEFSCFFKNRILTRMLRNRLKPCFSAFTI